VVALSVSPNPGHCAGDWTTGNVTSNFGSLADCLIVEAPAWSVAESMEQLCDRASEVDADQVGLSLLVVPTMEVRAN
jgi:hypothetical protein